MVTNLEAGNWELSVSTLPILDLIAKEYIQLLRREERCLEKRSDYS